MLYDLADCQPAVVTNLSVLAAILSVTANPATLTLPGAVRERGDSYDSLSEVQQSSEQEVLPDNGNLGAVWWFVRRNHAERSMECPADKEDNEEMVSCARVSTVARNLAPLSQTMNSRVPEALEVRPFQTICRRHGHGREYD